MDKKSPKTPKRKSLANVNVSPNKVQKTGPSPKKNKSPAVQKNQKTPQKKQLNGRQNTPKPIKKEPEEEEEEEFEEESENEEVQNGNNEDSIEDQDDSDNESDEQEQKPANKKLNKASKKEVVLPDERKFSVFIGGLNFQTTEDNIRAHFDKTNILSVVLLRNPVNNRPRGSAFINFKDEASLKKGLQKNESQLDGRTIKVSLPQKTGKKIGLSRKRNILAALKRKVQKLEEELGQDAISPKKAKVANKKPNNKNKKVESK